ncbi:MAG: MBL fold metallo-hydrolase [Chloroflexi bacterium]|nr:MBL fold metallo-hydrolase [Chloroflexota bacterium]
MLVKNIPIENLSNQSYLLVSQEAGLAAVIDPARDVDMYIQEAERLGVRIIYTLDTHLHNDFLSGSRELAARTGAQVGASAPSGLLYPHMALSEGDTLSLGELQIGVLQTPGHTPEHVTFTVTEPGRGSTPLALFTGGALMIGGAARVDLLGERLGPFLARWQYRTMQRKFLSLPDDVTVYPTHGGGSFCSAAPASEDGATSTTIGAERRTNPLLLVTDEDEYVELALGSLGSYPAYYKHMAGINRQGPPLLGGLPKLAPLSAREAHDHLEGGALLVDLRTAEAFGEGHVPGSYAVPFGDSFATWVGWVMPWGSQLAFLADDSSQHEALVRQLIRIGYDNFIGYIESGIEGWESAGYTTASVARVSADELRVQIDGETPTLVLDVRQRYEWRAGRIPAAVNIELGELQEHLEGLPRGFPLVSACASGVRATTAASILMREGFSDVKLLTGGTNAWLDAGYPAERGAE